MIKSPRCF